jgi:release factor glutamine methyltransferase
VFVPRPETEVVAGAAIDVARGLTAPLVVDLCTGSGAIALAVATEVPDAEVHAVELSDQALAWAARNVARFAPDLDLRAGDAGSAFGDLDGVVDVVVSNPPYIPPDCEPVDPEVRDHDPEVALYGLGADGLQVPREVVAAAARLLRPGGTLVMEHADVQQAVLLRSLSSSGLWRDEAGHRDLTGTPRYVTARRA